MDPGPFMKAIPRIQEGRAMRKGMKRHIVKLEYSLSGRNERDALDFLVRAVRKAAEHELDRAVELLRTDARRPGEIGDW